jgi:hypothetical protein
VKIVPTPIHHPRSPRVELFDADHFSDAPKPIHQAVKDLQRLLEVRAEAWTERDRAQAAVNRAEQKDTAAVAAAYADGGSGKVDPTAHQRQAKERAEAAQTRLNGISRAVGVAVANLTEAVAEHGGEWEAKQLVALATAEGRLQKLMEEGRAVAKELHLAASFVKLAQGRSLVAEGWSGGQRLAAALAVLEESTSFLGADGELPIVAPFDREEVDA